MWASDTAVVRRVVSTLLLAIPWIVVVAYGLLIADYARYLDSALQYKQPVFPRALEDVLGFGFWPTWLAALALLAVSGAIAYKFAKRRVAYFASLAGVFLVLTGLDYFLYQTLSHHLLR